MGTSGPQEETEEDEDTVDVYEWIETIREDNRNALPEVSKILDDHVASEDIILTFGYSNLCLSCFKDAKSNKKDIKVLVVDDQILSSTRMVTELTEAGLKSYRVAYSSVCTVMPKVSKVIVDSCAVMADGGIIGFSGIYGLGITAKEYSVPFLVVSPVYKLTPKYSFGQQTFNALLNPSDILQEENKPGQENIDTLIPFYDFLPPDFITLHINQKGEHSTSYIYRLFDEFYTKEETNANY